MALPDSAKITIGTPIVVADSTDYVDNQGMGARTNQIDLTSLAAGAARQSPPLAKLWIFIFLGVIAVLPRLITLVVLAGQIQLIPDIVATWQIRSNNFSILGLWSLRCKRLQPYKLILVSAPLHQELDMVHLLW